MIMQILKTRDVKTPSRANVGDAGIDFFIPNDFVEKTVLPGESLLVPSGIVAAVPSGYMLTAFNKSGMSLKKNMIIGACVIDHSYTGEIHIHLFNVGTTPQVFKPGDKVSQFILVPVLEDGITEVGSREELFSGKATTRGDGAFGSTDRRA